MIVIDEDVKEQIIDKYLSSRKRVIFLDYDGTLVPFDTNPANAVPGRQIIRILRKLTLKNNVIIISGRDQKSLDKWLSGLDLTLIAEHGAFVKRMRQNNWESNIDASFAWKDQTREIMKRYVDRCPDSFIEEKEAALAWHYRKSSADFAFSRSRELLDELNEFAAVVKNIAVIDGKK